MERRLRGHKETIGERMARDIDALLPQPTVPYEACDKRTTRVSSSSLVRYRTNDYSVPVAYGHRDVLVRGYVDRVAISCGAEVIARHPRSYQRDDYVFNPIHYLPLLEQKTGALDQAAALAGRELPEEFETLRRLLESRMGRRGKREYVQVLRLMENFRKEEVHRAVGDALDLGAISFDATKHLLLSRIENRPTILDKIKNLFYCVHDQHIDAAIFGLFSACHVLLMGPVGVGKSFIAQALSYAAIRAGYTVRFLHADIFFRAMAQVRVDNSVDRTFRSFLSPDLLILDDLGLHRLTAQQSADLYQLIICRHRVSSFVITSDEPWRNG